MLRFVQKSPAMSQNYEPFHTWRETSAYCPQWHWTAFIFQYAQSPRRLWTKFHVWCLRHLRLVHNQRLWCCPSPIWRKTMAISFAFDAQMESLTLTVNYAITSQLTHKCFVGSVFKKYTIWFATLTWTNKSKKIEIKPFHGVHLTTSHGNDNTPVVKVQSDAGAHYQERYKPFIHDTLSALRSRSTRNYATISRTMRLGRPKHSVAQSSMVSSSFLKDSKTTIKEKFVRKWR